MYWQFSRSKHRDPGAPLLYRVSHSAGLLILDVDNCGRNLETSMHLGT